MSRLVMKPGALREIRYSQEVARELEGHGRRIMAQANTDLAPTEDIEPGYRMSSQPGRRRPSGRWRVTVMAVSIHARRHDRKHNTLTKLLGR